MGSPEKIAWPVAPEKNAGQSRGQHHVLEVLDENPSPGDEAPMKEMLKGGRGTAVPLALFQEPINPETTEKERKLQEIAPPYPELSVRVLTPVMIVVKSARNSETMLGGSMKTKMILCKIRLILHWRLRL
jgi:hypothetical protein